MPFAVNWKLCLSTAFLLGFFASGGIMAMAIDDNLPLVSWSMPKETPQNSTKDLVLAPEAKSPKTPSQAVFELLPRNQMKASESASTVRSKKGPTRDKTVPSNSTPSDRLLVAQRYLLVTMYFTMAVCMFACLLCTCYIINTCNGPLFSELNTSTYVVNRDETLLASIHNPHPTSNADYSVNYQPKVIKRNNTGRPQSQVRAPEGPLNQVIIPFTGVALGTKAGASFKDNHYRLISGSNKSPTNYPVSPTESESLQGVGENQADLLSCSPTPPALLHTAAKPKRKQHPRQLMATATVNIRVESVDDAENQEDEAPPPKRTRHSKTFSLNK